MSDYPRVLLAKGKNKRLKSGHLWIFSNEIVHPEERPEPGTVVQVCEANGEHAGTGFYHPHSLIAIRLLSGQLLSVDAGFWKQRLGNAISARDSLAQSTNAMRLVHSESDGLPGLVVDKYAGGLVLQILSAGMEKQRNIIVDALKELLDPDFIVLRNDHAMRDREGLEQHTEVIHGEVNDLSVSITENSVMYRVDPVEGQKTGFYLDQRDNRVLFRHYISEGDRVLDGFCHYGGFALNAAQAGAKEVVAVDGVQSVCDAAQEHVRMNGLDEVISVQKADLMKKLPEWSAKGARFDAINLDPPNFATSKKSVGPALRAYRKIHRHALEMLQPGGILATSSCSHHITADAFLDSVRRACRDTGKRVQLLHEGGAAPDHPVLPEMPETGYLKFLIFRVVDF
ncbi:class I SAM-dependent rRNA methyltransferase [Natronogracilivirga saccharolytica]|uniref:Class I SAM-dependent rRNA methyltransferase n=1 Tax=Natronogracilivirga saccharolytica TaxID=2812953 RepID=A0A8J7RSC1_9BACT|nr:class I SAM-dependent rRNA methyltransferase [Natronogracilivirga saccharolytica]MBP3192042.1 class I SAM-dependent rRNA methyltransferase [Natronogracilivirga saccharolytica]